MKYASAGLNPSAFFLPVLMFFFCCQPLSAQPGNGYAGSFSYTKGDTVRLHVSTASKSYSARVFRQGASETDAALFHNIPGNLYADPDSAWESGCLWPSDYSFQIKNSWQPGVYIARIPGRNGTGLSNILFLVKEKVPGSYSKLLVVLPYFNWVAYNNYGGKNVYDENSTNNKRAYRVSFNRPFMQNGYMEFRGWGEKLISFLEKNGYKYEVASQLDIHNDSTLLRNYKTVVTVGHDEYYSWQLRKNITDFISSGGRYMSLSGNTCWWQVRIENGALICYKSRSLDPYYGKADSLVTVNWYDAPVSFPENTFLGASFRTGGYVNDRNHSSFTFSQGFGGYGVFNSQHWIYSNTWLKEGDVFGRLDSAGAVAGYEVDAAEFKWVNGLPEVTGKDGTPPNFRILGITPAVGQGGIMKDRYGTMGVYYTPKGGAVFNASTINWAGGLTRDTTVQRITINVLERFLNHGFPPEITSWGPDSLASSRVNGMDVKISTRTINMEFADSLKFHITAEDPYHDTIRYNWYLNSKHINADSILNFRPSKSGTFKLTAFASNSLDSSSVSWTLKIKDQVNSISDNINNYKYRLEQNYPNPFNPSTAIKYSLASESRVKLKIINLLGQSVSELVNRTEKPGNYSIDFNAGNLASGIYFYTLEAVSLSGSSTYYSVKKMNLIK